LATALADLTDEQIDALPQEALDALLKSIATNLDIEGTRLGNDPQSDLDLEDETSIPAIAAELTPKLNAEPERESIEYIQALTEQMRNLHKTPAPQATELTYDDYLQAEDAEIIGGLIVPSPSMNAEILLGDSSGRNFGVAVERKNANPHSADIDAAIDQANFNRADPYISAKASAVAKRQALPNGEWPIRNRQELVDSIARYLDPVNIDALSATYGAADIQRHLIQRARAMQLTSLLPADWGVSLERRLAESILWQERDEQIGPLEIPTVMGEGWAD
jgi:hypothetical protein